MTDDILEKAQILAQAITQSSELAQLKSTEKLMLANEEAKKVISEFQVAQQRLADLQESGQEPTLEDKESVAIIETKVENNTLISDYLGAQDNFTEMLDTVNAILASAIAGEDSEGCSGCGSGGCSTDSGDSGCDTNSCGCGGSC
ncbi:MAG: YlbF family regulator [Desulfitobacteriaceae bacterium]